MEGPTNDPAIIARRQGDIRALLATLFASRGAIQLSAGDEFGHSQQGNNNAYAQDNDITWLDWSGRDRALEDFVAMLAGLRAANLPLRDPTFLAVCDWRDLDGAPMTPEKWEAPDLAGFELHQGEIVIRVDRPVRQCTIFTPPETSR